MKYKTIKIIDVNDFDKLVEVTYGRIYVFQQQDGCKDRGIEYFTIPIKSPYDYKNDTVPEIINHKEMGVSFKAWLERDPKQTLESNPDNKFSLQLWWQRNFYPHFDMILHDLHTRGLIEPGEYAINIDW